MSNKVVLGKELQEHLKPFNKGRKAQLELLLGEIKDYNYSTFAQLKGAIHTHLELIEEKEG